MEIETARLGRHTTVLVGENRGKYPHGSSLVVEGPEGSLLIDPSLTLNDAASLPRVDRVVHSHCHEDHWAGSHLFRDVPWHFHELDAPGIVSLDAMMEIYGYDESYPEIDAEFRKQVVERFHFSPRDDALAYRDGDVFELGGDVRVTAIHSPGHTRGHCFLHVEPDDVLYLGDVDLSSFGPYYGDAWSDLQSFERTLADARGRKHRFYATFHHIGVLDSREAYLERLERFAAKIVERETRLLEFLASPRTLSEIVTHRFVYRPKDPVPFADAVEKRSMLQHLERLERDGQVRKTGEDAWAAV